MLVLVMDWHQQITPGSGSSSVSAHESTNGGLDVKPLRTLAPMFPTTPGFNTFSQSSSSTIVYVSPSGFPFQPIDQMPAKTTPTHNGVLPHSYSNGYDDDWDDDDASDEEENDDEEVVFLSGHTLASGRKIKKPKHYDGSGGGSSSKGKLQKKKAKRVVPRSDPGLIPSLLDPRDSVEVVLMTYDALRRWLSQLEDGKEGKSQRPDLRAGTILMGSDLRANIGKRVGSVPGVEIGDIFYFRMELCLVGLHAQSMGGIDCMKTMIGDGEETVAVSVVSAGGYENEETDVDALIYTGQGGNTNIDQKLERGNLGLQRSLHYGYAIRVIRSVKDYSILNGKIYFYDGLYKIESSWVEKGKLGHNVFKYKLLREPDQPQGLATWKMTRQWKDNPSTRSRITLNDISYGVENLPVCIVNEIDNEREPKQFRYFTKVEYSHPLSSMMPVGICRCNSVCLPGDQNCTCAKLNGGNLPYSANGTLIRRKALIFECNASCSCSHNCRNRVAQKGVRHQFEVFKTRDRGWGVRSWDPIRAGSFVSEYAGEVFDRINLNDGNDDDDEYIFRADGAGVKSLKWNYGPELLGESSDDHSSETLGSLPIVISAKKMGNISRFMNHSCSPNVFWQPVLHDHGDEGYPHIMFYAIKHIPPMTELTYDYGVSDGGNSSGRAKKCLCGSSKCRGYFG